MLLCPESLRDTMDTECDAEVEKHATKARKAMLNKGTLTSAQKDKVFGEALSQLLRNSTVKLYLRVLALTR